MPLAARLRRLCWYAWIQWSRRRPPRLMSSCTGTLSTTDHVSPEASISSLRSAMASAVHTCPFGISCSAVTIPVAPVCLMSARVIGSLGPNHLQVCCMNCLLGLVVKAIADARSFRCCGRSVSYTHLRAHETRHDLVCRLLL